MTARGVEVVHMSTVLLPESVESTLWRAALQVALTVAVTICGAGNEGRA